MLFYKFTKKSLSQNFLVDRNIINKIIDIGDIQKDKVVLEIGPGYGSLIKEISNKNPKKIIAIEKDKKLFLYLKDYFKNNENIEIINDDILNFLKIKRLFNDVLVFGNLPYNISTKILTSLILLKKWPPWYNNLIFMFQKEVADRIVAKNSTKEYGRLSIISNWRFEIKKHFDVSRNCFKPKPKVNSSVLSFKPVKNYKYYLKKPETLEHITRVLFSGRRKMINKNFNKLFKGNTSIAKKLNLDLSLRPQNLSNEMYYKIAVFYEKLFY